MQVAAKGQTWRPESRFREVHIRLSGKNCLPWMLFVIAVIGTNSFCIKNAYTLSQLSFPSELYSLMLVTPWIRCSAEGLENGEP
jgi:hypothetical protein